LSTTNPTWLDRGLNPGRHGGTPATKRLSYGAATACRFQPVCFFYATKPDIHRGRGTENLLHWASNVTAGYKFHLWEMSLSYYIITQWRRDPLLWAPAAYACAVTTHNNRRCNAGGVFCGSTPRLYESTDRVLLSSGGQAYDLSSA
jgi:hypothetical protein